METCHDSEICFQDCIDYSNNISEDNRISSYQHQEQGERQDGDIRDSHDNNIASIVIKNSHGKSTSHLLGSPNRPARSAGGSNVDTRMTAKWTKSATFLGTYVKPPKRSEMPPMMKTP